MSRPMKHKREHEVGKRAGALCDVHRKVRSAVGGATAPGAFPDEPTTPQARAFIRHLGGAEAICLRFSGSWFLRWGRFSTHRVARPRKVEASCL